MNWLDKISPSPRHCGYLPFPHGVINPWRVISDFELFMFTDGKAKFIVEDKDIDCPAPYFVIIPPGTKHISYCLSKSVTVYWCHFDWTWQENSQHHVTYDIEKIKKNSFHYPDFIPKQLLHGPVKHAQVLQLHKTMCRLFQSNIASEKRMARSFYLQELLYLLDDQQEETIPSNHEDEIANNVRNCLNELSREPFSKMRPVKDAISKLGQSYFHQERLFKKKYKITPYQYLNAIRIEQIKEMLINSSYTISEIAHDQGFEDLAYFSRYFSKHTGISPRVFRQNRTS